jgi:mono/diheme cytochrome c family protein
VVVRTLVIALAGAAALASGVAAGDPDRGQELLLTKAYLPADFDQEVFDSLWTLWEEPLRSRAERAPLEERRRMAMERYGLTPHPLDPSRSLQYVVDAQGRWTMSCLACHQGQVEGRPLPGVPNADYALETLTEEVRQVKVRQRKALGHMDVGSLLLPLGTTAGTTNAVVFGVALMRHRDADLNIIAASPQLVYPHHDMDAPAWWHYRRRRQIYADGFAPKGHRMLMQFLLVKENGPERFAEWEDDYRHVEAWLESLEAPIWPGTVDALLAARGRALYANHCAPCHGAPARDPRVADGYPERMVPIDEIGTDRARFDALTTDQRRSLSGSWFGRGAVAPVAGSESPSGYVAPPLDGIWASAPYLHNGSVPTLWHLLHPAERPTVWRRAAPAGYDRERVGLAVESLPAMPTGTLLPVERRRHFDTTRPGKSAAGHDFPDALDEEGKVAVLEYLKTL